MLDFAVDEASFGKPSGGADLRLGLATAPTLYAWEEFEEMGPLIERRFEREGDVELVRLFFLVPLGNLSPDFSFCPSGNSEACGWLILDAGS